MNHHVVCIGECMMELQLQNLKSSGLTHGGDVFNTAFAINQCLRGELKVSFLSALGDDEFSQQMVTAWQRQGIDTQYVSILANSLPGLYITKTDKTGERTFSYWRNESAARKLFQSPRFPLLLEELNAPRCLYFSGISLAIMSAANRECLLHYANCWSDAGSLVVFDSNYREQLWPSIDEARIWTNAAWEVTDIALPTLSDDHQLYALESAEESIAKLRTAGVGGGAVKLGKDGCLTFDDSHSIAVSVPASVKVIDTTGAGDAFNGAFIASYLLHKNTDQAGRAGVTRASETVQHFGAIPPL